MEKEFIPYEQASALKEIGFDEPCLGWYASDGSLIKDYVTNKFNEFTVAPLYQQAFRWFREKHHFIACVIPCSDTYRAELYREGFIGSVRRRYFSFADTLSIHYITYEEAETACLKELIELVKQKQ